MEYNVTMLWNAWLPFNDYGIHGTLVVTIVECMVTIVECMVTIVEWMDYCGMDGLLWNTMLPCCGMDGYHWVTSRREKKAHVS